MPTSLIFKFKPLALNDLDLLCQWFSKSHVKEWWDDVLTDAEIKEKYGSRIGDDVVHAYIVYLNEKPFGFIQYYYADKVGDGWWPDEKQGTVGIDQFIGEENFLNQGYGTQMIRAFCNMLFKDPSINKIITDVDPHNIRAFRCYQKIFNNLIENVNTPDGVAHVLFINRDDFNFS